MTQAFPTEVRIMCAACGVLLQTPHYAEIDMPLSRGNPYPQPLLVCKNARCIAKGEAMAQDAYADIADDPWEQEEDDS